MCSSDLKVRICHSVQCAGDGPAAKSPNEKGDDEDGKNVKRGAGEPIPYLLGVFAERHSGRLTSLKQIVIKCPRNFAELLAIFTPLSARATR